MGISSSGLISGLNTDEIISQLLKLERRPIELLEQNQKQFETRLTSLLEVNIKLSSFARAAAAINSAQNFNTKSVEVAKTASGEALATAAVQDTAAPGTHTLQVSQLAQAHKVASQGFADLTTTPVLDTVGFPSGGNFSFKVGASGAVRTVAITATTTLQQLQDAINGANAGVTASILNDGTATNPYRLVLTSTSTGSTQKIEVTSNATTLDLSTKRIEAAAAALTNTGTYTGTVTSSGTYTGTANKTFLLEIITAGTVGAARYKVSTDGGVTFDDNGGAGYALSTGATAIGSNTEGVSIAFSDDGSSLSTGDRFTVDVFNPTLQQAQDAVVSIDNLTLVKSSNTVSDVLEGITLNLVKAQAGTTVNLTVSTDTSAAVEKIDSFVSAYNDIAEYLNEQQSYDPEVGKANPLLGDFTIRDLQHTIQSIVTSAIPGVTSGKLSLAQVGITSNSQTGELSLDESALTSALSADPAGVLKLFVGTGTPTSNAVSFISKTAKTQVGKYAVNVTTAPQQASFTSATQLQAAGLGADELLSFTFSSNATSSTPTSTGFSVNLTQNDTIHTVVNKLNSAFATKGVALQAVQANGQLSITSKDYGADIRFTVVSDQAASTSSTGVGTIVLSQTGVDVAGSVGGATAVGKGRSLTGARGAEGLVLSVTGSTTGSLGTVSVSSGVGEQLQYAFEDFLSPTSGVLKSRQDSIQDRIDNLAEQIAAKEAGLKVKEERLRSRFTSLELLLSKFQAQSEFLTNQLAKLPGISSS